MVKLVIGNKTTSSWSLRPWLVMRHFELPFEEIAIQLRHSDFKEKIKKYSPAGLVPTLIDGDLTVWDSLAICEYLAEKNPDAHLWPEDGRARAQARCYASEMHSGFPNLRTVWPMDLSVVDAGVICPIVVRKEIDRVLMLWTEARERHAGEGKFLFGEFSIADAFFAPVVFRLRSFGPVAMPKVCQDYMQDMLDLPSVQEWMKGANEEIEAGWYSD